MKAVIISIGDELTSGSSLDTNSAWLADRLTLLGVDVLWHATLGDDSTQVSECLRAAAGEADWILVTGGLGPTEDDRTRAALASAMGVPLEFEPASWEAIQAFSSDETCHLQTKCRRKNRGAAGPSRMRGEPRRESPPN
jgi:nicotinamide-nucleotide amidase